MRRWISRIVHSTACTRPCSLGIPRHITRPRLFSHNSRPYAPAAPQRWPRKARKYAIFDRIEEPERSVHTWLALLDGALPPHLRDWSAPDYEPPNLSAVDVAEVLLAAQNPSRDGDDAFDLLFHLGLTQSRWNAVTWLIKKLVEKFPVRHARTPPLSEVNALWSDAPPLAVVTAAPQNATLPELTLRPDQSHTLSLDYLTWRASSDKHEDLLGHEALGQVWRTLGVMTLACAGGEIKPEVLEIIAYLHHKEVMPMSIYQAEPHSDKSAIQQPPLLSVLSSAILTSLSDAAWRAHERLIIEEAKARENAAAALRPEIPGSVYRVRVAGLRPELWLELILWSCIHGGWLLPGADILRAVFKDRTWSALSWQEYEKTIPSKDRMSSPTWPQWEHAFKTRAASTRDDSSDTVIKVDRTVSAEVVNAYVDALAITLNLGVGGSAIGFEDLYRRFWELRKFLMRKDFDLALSFGSWDALIARVIESNAIVPERDSGEIQQLVSLTSGLGAGLWAKNTQDLPKYVQDGNSAMQGLLHRALYGQIAAGSLDGALQIFRQIQTRADQDKKASLNSFMKTGRMGSPTMPRLLESDMFTSNNAGIDYPAFDLKIPATVLGSFLNLVTDAKEFDFGRWLLYNDEVDGTVIAEAQYTNPFIQPAVLRFAAESNDQALLAKFREQNLHRHSLHAVLHTQISAMRWDAARRTLEYLAGTPGQTWTVEHLATVVRVMLFQTSGVNAGSESARKQLLEAKSMFGDLCRDRYKGPKYTGKDLSPASHASQVQNLLAVFSAIDESWAKYCETFRNRYRYRQFRMSTKAFNSVLGGVVQAYGSAAGRRLLGVFWPRSARRAHDATYQLSRNISGRVRIPRHRPTIQGSTGRQRIAIAVPAKDDQSSTELVLYGALTPNVTTILIILDKALEEHQQASTIASRGADSAEQAVATAPDDHHTESAAILAPRAMIKWAIRRLAELPYVEGSITERLDETLSEHGMDDLRAELPNIIRVVQTEAKAEAGTADGSEGSVKIEDLETSTTSSSPSVHLHQ